MGRKIPGKKHRTIKDPYQQRQKRLDRVRLKINNPPSNINEQEIPKSLKTIMELKKQAKEITVKKTRRRRKKQNKTPVVLSVAKHLDKDPIIKGMKRPDEYIPNLVQRPNESDHHFLARVSSMTKNLINEVEFEKKFGVEIRKNSETGQVLEVKKLKNKKTKSKKTKLTEKRKAKLNQKLENLKNEKDFNQLKDKVEFGEVVHRPPTLPSIKTKMETIKKPKFSNLLLNTVVEGSQSKGKNIQTSFEKEKKENERKFIVEAYRKIKKKIKT